MPRKVARSTIPEAQFVLPAPPSEAPEVTRLVNPKIAIPKHFWWEQAVQQYTEGLSRVKMMKSPVLKISKPELPQPTETVVLPRQHR